MLATRLVLIRGPLILIVFHCYFVSTFCEDRINTFLILMAETPEQLQKALNAVSDYCSQWNLTVNTYVLARQKL